MSILRFKLNLVQWTKEILQHPRHASSLDPRSPRFILRQVQHGFWACWCSTCDEVVEDFFRQ